MRSKLIDIVFVLFIDKKRQTNILMTQIKSVLYLSGLSLHQFVYVIFNEPCDRWKFAQKMYTFMELKSKHCKCNVKKRKNPPKISIFHPSIHLSTHCVCIQFGWFFQSICSAMHISYYHLYQCMCLNVSVLN